MSNAEIQIVSLTRSPRDVARFLAVGYAIYARDPQWVAPLLMDIKKVFSDQNPFFVHAEMQLWVAVQNGQDVGRMAGIYDRNYVDYQKDNTAFFGFFESIHNSAVSQLLFRAVNDWARSNKVERLIGPMNPTSNDECGLLIEGFNSSPAIMMTYNPPYYADLVQAAGFRKAKDLLAFVIDVKDVPGERLGRISEVFGRRQPGITVRRIRRKGLAQDLAKVKEVYNAAWQENWGFVPMTDAEINFMAARLKPLLVDGLNYIAETASEPVAFMLLLPDYYEAFRPLKGRLFTPGLLRALPYLVGLKRPRMARLVAFGIKQKFRGRGIEAVIFAEGLKAVSRAGYAACEASWILEDNLDVQRLLKSFAAKVYKTYRLYEREVVEPGSRSMGSEVYPTR